MGIEIGPDNHLYYVDNGRDQVVRIDSYYDIDTDGVLDENDNCLEIFNPVKKIMIVIHLGDACDTDDDNDSVLDEYDLCPKGQTGWMSLSSNRP